MPFARSVSRPAQPSSDRKVPAEPWSCKGFYSLNAVQVNCMQKEKKIITIRCPAAWLADVHCAELIKASSLRKSVLLASAFAVRCRGVAALPQAGHRSFVMLHSHNLPRYWCVNLTRVTHLQVGIPRDTHRHVMPACIGQYINLLSRGVARQAQHFYS
jgi:hypothetical protein